MPILRNSKHELFAQKVAKGMNESSAYAEVYGRDKEEGPTRGNASRLRSKGIVAARILELQEAMVDKTIADGKEVLRLLTEIARFDLGKAFDENGNLLNVQDIPPDVRRAMASIKVFEEFEGFGRDRTKIGETREVKSYDKNASLKLLGLHHGLFTEKVQHSVDESLEDLLTRSWGEPEA